MIEQSFVLVVYIAMVALIFATCSYTIIKFDRVFLSVLGRFNSKSINTKELSSISFLKYFKLHSLNIEFKNLMFLISIFSLSLMPIIFFPIWKKFEVYGISLSPSLTIHNLSFFYLIVSLIAIDKISILFGSFLRKNESISLIEMIKKGFVVEFPVFLICIYKTSFFRVYSIDDLVKGLPFDLFSDPLLLIMESFWFVALAIMLVVKLKDIVSLLKGKLVNTNSEKDRYVIANKFLSFFKISIFMYWVVLIVFYFVGDKITILEWYTNLNLAPVYFELLSLVSLLLKIVFVLFVITFFSYANLNFSMKPIARISCINSAFVIILLSIKMVLT